MSLIRPSAGGVTLERGVGEPGAAVAAERGAHAAPRGQPPASVPGAQGAVRQSVRAAHGRKRAALRHDAVGLARSRTRPPTARRNMRAARSSPRAARSAFLGHADRSIPIGSAEFGLDWDIARGTLRVPFKIDVGLDARHAARRVRGARANRRQLAVRRRRRPDRARSACRRTTKVCCSSASLLRGAIDPGPAADHARAGRFRHQGARRRATARTSASRFPA